MDERILDVSIWVFSDIAKEKIKRSEAEKQTIAYLICYEVLYSIKTYRYEHHKYLNQRTTEDK